MNISKYSQLALNPYLHGGHEDVFLLSITNKTVLWRVFVWYT